jgi:hypothetical protein
MEELIDLIEEYILIHFSSELNAALVFSSRIGFSIF